MTEAQARAVAEALGFEARHTGGETWICVKTLVNGKLIVMCDEDVCTYDNEEAYYDGIHSKLITFV